MENGTLTEKRLLLDALIKNVNSTREKAIAQSILIRKAIANSEKEKVKNPEKKTEIENQLRKYDELLKQLLTVIDEINTYSPEYQLSLNQLQEAEQANPEVPAVR
ncbi:hypothetical protein Lrub_0862 [Legionella rubrilucens]|uniref:Coiled-coil protein n=1 Tax=Legionella rubrilucens TaxID=458 RepID=A0A0W0XVK8_9GAMM|nr:hypothetical protein [Legionella rubrilucens]KTD48511.1 hypothetical protein Lrub_0862 [Legionella rubrilucens]